MIHDIILSLLSDRESQVIKELLVSPCTFNSSDFANFSRFRRWKSLRTSFIQLR